MNFEDKVRITHEWVKAVNKYWIICEGELFNHKEFWSETFHSMSNEDWEDMIAVMDVVKATEPGVVSDIAAVAFDEVKQVLMYEAHSGNPRALDSRKHKRKAFKALMNIKDIINDLSGYKQPTKFPKKSTPTGFENLFSRGEDNDQPQ